MYKTWRLRLIILGIVSVSIGVALLIAWQSASTYVRRKLESQLREISKAPVEVEAVELAWRQVVASEIRVIDVSNGKPWLQVRRLVANIGLWDAIIGRTRPELVVVHGTCLTLRFDQEGNLLTRVPEPASGESMPRSILLRDASMTLEQEGSIPLRVTQINGQVDAKSDGFEATATIGDALNSEWELVATRGEVMNAIISTPRLQLSGDELAQLPQAPAALAEIERFSASVKIQLRLSESTAGVLDPRIDVNLSSLEANVPAADVNLTDGSAEVVIEDQRLHLNSLKGSIAGGQVVLAAEMNLVEKSGTVSGRVAGMSLTSLPSRWGVPSRFTGQLAGEATLQIDSSGSDMFLAGTTRGTITDAHVADLAIEPVEVEIDLDRRSLGDKLSGGLRVGLAVSQLDLHELLTRLDPETDELTEQPAGLLTGTLQLTAPLEALNDPQRYTGTGKLNASQITLGQLAVRDVASNILIEQGRLSLDQVSCKFAGGSVQGQMVAEMDTGGAAANFRFDELSIGELAKITTAFPDELAGDVSGETKLVGSWKELASIDTWAGGGRLKSGRIEFHEDVLIDTVASLDVSEGVLQLNDVRTAWTDSEITGTATFEFHSPYAFAAQIATSEISLEKTVQRFEVLSELKHIQGAAAIKANLSGTLMPLQWKVDGDAGFKAVTLDSWEIGGGDMQWHLDQDKLQVTQLEVDAYGGELNATASFPFDAGPIELQGTFTNVLTESLPVSPDSKFKLIGAAAGSFSLTKSKPAGNVAASVEFRGPSLSAHAVEVSDLIGNCSYHDGGLQLEIKGQALGGMLSVNGRGTVGKADLADAVFDGKLHVERIDLSALSALSENRQVQQLQGSGNADVDFKIAGLAGAPTATGTMSVGRLRWKNIDLASSANAKVSLLDNTLILQRFSATMPEGTASGEMTVPLTAGRRGTFRLNLERVRSRRLLALWPSLARTAEGTLDLRLEGRMDRQWYGSGQMRMSRAQLAGIPIQRLHAPVQWTFAPDTNRFQLKTHEATAHVGHGRLTTNLQLTAGRTLDIKCDGKVQAIDIKTLLTKAPGASRAVGGALTADFSFEGRDVRSANDLTGRYSGNVAQSQTMLLPVFQDLAGALGLGSLTRTFDLTESRGRLIRGGVIRVDEMHLANSDVQMEISGRVLLNGRIDLDVTAHAGEFAASSLLGQLLRSPLRFVQPVGIGLLIQANDFLERRLLFFKLGGTIQNPTVRPRANEFLQQEAILYFLDQASSQLLP